MTDLDHGHYQRLAADLLTDAVNVLKGGPPPQRPPKDPKARREWRKAWERWESERRRDLQFFNEPARSAAWCETAGVSYDAIVSKLDADGLLYDPADKFPTDMRGRSLIYPEPVADPEPAVDPYELIPCPECKMPCKGKRALAIHQASCMGRETAEAMVRDYVNGVGTVEICERHEVRGDVFYRVLTAHGIPRRQRSGRSPT